MKKVYIYALCNPDSGEIRYIGSSFDPKKRLRQHIAMRDFPKVNDKKRWVSRLYNSGKRPKVKILECCPGNKRGEREDWWIDKLRGEGARLLNGRRAGSKLYDFSQKS